MSFPGVIDQILKKNIHHFFGKPEEDRMFVIFKNSYKKYGSKEKIKISGKFCKNYLDIF
jgi:hypothetical protein